MAEVRSQEGESIENLLRRFKRKVQTEDIIKDVKRHSFYLKPGDKKRVKQALARKRARKKSRTNGRPVLIGLLFGGDSRLGLSRIKMVRPERFELPTLGSEDRCSIQLSYGRKIRTVHPLAYCSKSE